MPAKKTTAKKTTAKKPATKKTTAKKPTTKKAPSVSFTAEERAAMKEYAAELKAAAKGADGAAQVLAKIASMPEPDRSLGKRVHEIVMAAAPTLVPRTWYGMPAYTKDDKVVCFFQNASKFKYRYSTLGFQDAANIDSGSMWPVAFALKDLSTADEAKITALVKKAVR
jgi:hypothetical protein